MTVTTRIPLARVLAVLFATLLLLAACGGEDAAEEPAADTAADAPATPTETPTPVPADTATEMAATETAPAADGTAAPEAAATDMAGATVMTSDSPLGEILVDGEGRTLYLLTADSPDESTCFDACAEAWPPFTTTDAATAGEGADASLLDTLERDGETQVAYNGWPLYYFQGDAGPDEVNGQGIESFGGTWWVLGPDGEPIEETASAAASVDY